MNELNSSIAHSILAVTNLRLIITTSEIDRDEFECCHGAAFNLDAIRILPHAVVGVCT